MCETYGRQNYAKISEGIHSKTVEEVRDYSQAFWKNWQTSIDNGHKFVERIEKGEAEIEKKKGIEEAIE